MKKTIQFMIVGMHCASCSVRNERALVRLPGVIDASVNFGTHTATVTFDTDATNETTLYDAVVRTGYKVMAAGHEDAQRAEDLRTVATAKWRMQLAIILSAPVVVIGMLNLAIPGQFLHISNSHWIQMILSIF